MPLTISPTDLTRKKDRIHRKALALEHSLGDIYAYLLEMAATQGFTEDDVHNHPQILLFCHIWHLKFKASKSEKQFLLD